MQYWLFNTDETEREGFGKYKAMFKHQVVSAWGYCKGLGAEVTMNRPDAGDAIFYFRAGYGIVACAIATDELSFPSSKIFSADGEYSRVIESLQVLPEDGYLTVAEIKDATGYQIPYRQIMGRIKDERAIKYLLSCFSRIKKSQPPRKSKTGNGVCFQPDPVQRKKVEKAAVRNVTDFYQKKGWRVRSVEQEKVGYDLHCTKGDQVERVEVKGTSGTKEEFILTANEYAKAQTDATFVLYLVTNSLNKPRPKKYSAKRLLEKFQLTPLSYRVKPKN